MKKNDIFIILCDLILVLLVYYFELPPLNLSSPEFWLFAFIVCIIIFISIILRNNSEFLLKKHLDTRIFKVYKYFFISIIVVLLVIGIINFFSIPLFNAK